VVLHHGDNVLTADRMKYYQQTEDAEVEGNVHLERPKEILKGTHLQINLQTEEGHLSEPRYYIKEGKDVAQAIFCYLRVKTTTG